MQQERIPRRVESVDIKQLGINAMEGYVHSCIDGVLNLEDLADLSGIDDDTLNQIVERLVGLGAVRWLAPDAESATTEMVPEIDEEVALGPDEQQHIRKLHGRLGQMSHYELLGLQRDAEKAAIRHAYFTLSKRFHPDAYFGKNLGPFKSQMEAIFTRLTDAYEVLGKKKKREAYDKYLSRTAQASAAEHEIERGAQRAEAMSRALTEHPSELTQEFAKAGQTRGRRRTNPRPGGRTAEDASARARRKRELLERRLRPRSRGQTQESRAPTSIPPGQKVGQKAALRGLTASLKQSAAVTGGAGKADHQIALAREAEANGDLAKAATALRMALAMAPDRHDLRAEYQQLEATLRVQLVDIHKEQANYEEENQMWQAASISWAKVADACPDDPVPPRRVAAALLRAGADLRKARDYAQRSRDLDPESVETLLLLGRIYVGAGMDASARRELQLAAKLDPRHQMVKDLLRELGG